MRRSELSPGARSLERGSTFAKPRSELKRTELTASPVTASGDSQRPALRRAPISPASPAQRSKVAGRASIVSGQSPCDPAHVWPRGRGGCNSVDCVIALTRLEHQAFDNGDLDILPYLIDHGCWVEMAHAVLVHQVDPIALLQRLTGDRWMVDPRNQKGTSA